MDLNGMQLGAVFPHNEIGTDPADIAAMKSAEDMLRAEKRLQEEIEQKKELAKDAGVSLTGAKELDISSMFVKAKVTNFNNC